MAPERTHKVGEVFGINRDLPVNYVMRQGIDDKLIDNLTRDCLFAMPQRLAARCSVSTSRT